MSKKKHAYGWIPDSDDLNNAYLRAMLLRAKIKKAKGKIFTPRKKVKKLGETTCLENI